MWSSRNCEYLGCMAEVEVELTTLGASLRTTRQKVVNRLATEYMTRICCNDGVLIRVSHGVLC